MKSTFLRLFLASLAVTFGAAVAHAQGQPVGRVLLAAGDTFAVRNGQQVRLQFNSPIEFRDVLRTGAASSLQVRFVDEGLISLRENSEFAIDEYRFASAQPDEERAFFRLLKGGFRSVTGLIGRTRNANYRVQTQTATIGIRGTDYGVRMCAGDCGQGVKDGLYGTVNGQSSGTNQITITNEGTGNTPRTFGINQHFYVADAKSPPQPLLQPPTFVSIRPQGKANAAQQGGSGSGGEQASSNTGANAESRPNAPETVVAQVVTPVVPYTITQTLNAAGTPAVLPPANGFGIIYPIGSNFEGLFDGNNSTATYDGSNNLTGYHIGTTAAGTLSGAIADTGQITAPNGQVFTWGRWTVDSVTTKSGSVLTNVPLLFITGSGVDTGLSATQIGGQATYTFRGGPQAVDAGGNLGTITSSTLGINFTTQSVSYAVGISFASISTFGPATLSLSGTGSPSTGFNTGEFRGSLSGSCSGGGCATTSVSGGFDVGLTGTVGYEFAVVMGGVANATKAGSVVFLNTYEVASYTPGAAPNAGGLTGEIVYANASPSVPGATFTLSSNLSTFSGTDLLSFTSPNSTLTGNLASGTITDRGAATLIDGSSINWGRWTGSTQVNDPVVGLISPSSGLPFVVGQNGNIPTSGSFTYSVVGGVGSTTTNTGAGGTVTAGTANVTFGTTSSIALSGLAFTAPSASGVLSFSGVGGSTTFTGSVVGNLTISGTCSGGGCSTGAPASGFSSGIFVGQQAAGLALTGALSAAGNTAVFGAALKR